MAVKKKIARKKKAVARKMKKIGALKKQMKKPSRTSGAKRIKDYNPSANKKIIARKSKAVARKKRKMAALSGDGKITRKDVLSGRGVLKKGGTKKRR
mgnify:FL=1